MASETTDEHANDELLQPTPEPGRVDLPGAKRTTKDSEPVDYMSKEVRRPYSQAVTDEHREFLRGSNIELDPKE